MELHGGVHKPDLYAIAEVLKSDPHTAWVGAWLENQGKNARVLSEMAKVKAENSQADEGGDGVLPADGDRASVGVKSGEGKIGGTKYDDGKPRLDLIPTLPLMAAGAVFGFGAKKYGDRNWEEGIIFSRLYGALLRHLFAFWNGEGSDKESDLSHLGHAMCCLLMLTDEYLNEKYWDMNLDDRPA